MAQQQREFARLTAEQAKQAELAKQNQQQNDFARLSAAREAQALKSALDQQQRDIDRRKAEQQATAQAAEQALEMERLKLESEKLDFQRQRDEAQAKQGVSVCHAWDVDCHHCSAAQHTIQDQCGVV